MIKNELALQFDQAKPILKNRVEEHIEKAVVKLAIEQPALGQLREIARFEKLRASFETLNFK